MKDEDKKHVDEVLKIFDDRKKLFVDKNTDYGCSYVKAGKIMELILDGEMPTICTPEDHMAYQLIIRKLDKMIRFCNLRFTFQEANVDEKLYDTMSDDGVYSFMLAEIEKNTPEQKKNTKVDYSFMLAEIEKNTPEQKKNTKVEIKE